MDNLHSGHRQRMFQRFMESGFDGYQPHEILEVLLFEVQPRRNTNELAHRLLDRFGSLRGVLCADRDALMQVRGVGRVTADYITSILPEVSRMMRDSLRGEPLTPENSLVPADFFLRFCDGEGEGK